VAQQWKSLYSIEYINRSKHKIHIIISIDKKPSRKFNIFSW
jgi:hypothetical protein